MSGLAGVLHLDGRAAATGDVSALLDAQVHRAADGAGALAKDCVALGVARLRTLPGALDLAASGDGLAGAIDGRVDDRRALADSLGLPVSSADLLLVLEGYRRWGEAVAARLVGEFAVVIWDSRERRLILFRDVMGVRPLAYRRTAGRLLIASEPQALARAEPASLNEGFLAEHLAGEVVSRDETLFSGVYRVPPAHVLIHEKGTLQLGCYWQPAARRTLRYRRPGDYVEHFEGLLRVAVEDRLRLCDGATLALSSGVDSSIVAAEIAALREGGHREAAATVTVTLAHAGRPEDESGRAAETAARLRLPGRAVAAMTPAEAHFADDARRSGDLPEPPTAASALPLRLAVRSAGHRVLLTGYGGDEWFAPHVESPWLRAWHRMPRRFRSTVRGVLRRSRVPPWIDRRFAARVNLHDRLGHYEPQVRLPTPAATALFHEAMHGELLWRREMSERLAAWNGFEERHPLFDRRIIEFACALPDDVRLRDGAGKWILRQAHRRTLPSWLAQPPASTGFNWVVTDCLHRFGGRARIQRSTPVRRGWLDAATMGALYDELERGRDGRALPLWDALAIEFFLDGMPIAR